MKKAIILAAVLFMMSAPNAFAQCCQADFDYDGNVYPSDLSVFLSEYGRTDCYPCGSNPASVPKTGQTTSYATGDDGDLEKGVAWPNPRFTDNLDGTITDNLTGLIWLKNANCFDMTSWYYALSDSNGLASGSCGLTDGSNAGEWRLPNYKELFSLIDAENYDPALPTGYPFNNVQSYYYWSSTAFANITGYVWLVNMGYGFVSNGDKYNSLYVRPVRGGR